MKYDVSIDTLKDLSTRFKWTCQYDEFIEENDEEDDFIDDPLDGKEPNIAYYEKQMKRKDKENMELKALIQQLQNKLKSNDNY
jgi:hypothetical protein